MTDKQITIDGVDVSGCKLFRNGICASPINPKCKLCVEISKKMCYYKQLKAKEQKCEELKQTLIEIKEIAERGFQHSQCNCGAKADLGLILQKTCEATNE